MPLVWDVAASHAALAARIADHENSKTQHSFPNQHSGVQASGAVDFSIARAAQPPVVNVLFPAFKAAVELWNCPKPWLVTGWPAGLQNALSTHGFEPACREHDWWIIPPVTELALEQLAQVLSVLPDPSETKRSLSRPAIVIDHYSHALLLQNMLGSLNITTPLSVALALRLVDRGEGVRPGHDLKDLWLGINRMPCLKIEAIWGDFSWLAESEVPAGLSLLQLATRQLAEHTKTVWPCIGHEVPPEHWSLVDDAGIAPVNSASMLSFSFPDWWQRLQQATASPLAVLQGTVISRPTIQTAVVNLGARHFQEVGWEVATGANQFINLRLLQDAGAKCQIVLAEKSLWELSPEAHDLRIGEAATCFPISEVSS